MTTARILHFPSGFRRYGLPLDQVGEVAVIDRIEPVPGAAAIVAGVAELRGRIVTLLALDGPGLLSAPPDGGALAVLLAGAYGHLGILVAGSSEDVETGWRSADVAPAAEGDLDRSEEDRDGLDRRSQDNGPRRIAKDRSANAVGAGPGPPGSRGDALGVPILLEEGLTVHLIDPESLAERCTDLVRRRFRVLDRVG